MKNLKHGNLKNLKSGYVIYWFYVKFIGIILY